jgi:hypothetical protein
MQIEMTFLIRSPDFDDSAYTTLTRPDASQRSPAIAHWQKCSDIILPIAPHPQIKFIQSYIKFGRFH